MRLSSFDPAICPSSVIPLDHSAVDILVGVIDQFSSRIQGKMLEDWPLHIQLSSSSLNDPKPFQLNLENQIEMINGSSGAALFPKVSFSSANNNTALITFNANYTTVYPVLLGISCTIKIDGCEPDYEVQENEDNTASCVPGHKVSKSALGFILLGVSFSLCCIVLPIVCVLVGYRIWYEECRSCHTLTCKFE